MPKRVAEPKTNITLLVSKAERLALKKLALDMDMTASALVRKWLHEHLEGIGAEIPAGSADMA